MHRAREHRGGPERVLRWTDRQVKVFETGRLELRSAPPCLLPLQQQIQGGLDSNRGHSLPQSEHEVLAQERC